MARGVSCLVLTDGVLCASCIGASLPRFVNISSLVLLKYFLCLLHEILTVYFIICRFYLFMKYEFLHVWFIH